MKNETIRSQHGAARALLNHADTDLSRRFFRTGGAATRKRSTTREEQEEEEERKAGLLWAASD
ncbi:hypothetical protein ABEB36_012174 [Hypothenemus hampei]|uniref:Uncharacterized protein n=1 Tax=Hypothenemus hampei TaxID=57062 RepID=A0ABD1EAE7_HYPHA